MKIFAVGRKKADLSLSINAIVILILAITVMGLGLTFIRGLFKGATEKLGGALEAAELKNPPSAEKQLTIDSKISTLLDEKKNIQIGVYNPDTAQMTGIIPVIINCVNSKGDPQTTGITLAAPSQNIAPRGIAGYSAILTASGITPDTYICTIGINGTGNPDIIGTISASTFIEVK